MILKVFAVYDSKALLYDRPFFVNTVGSAVRAFSDAVQDKNAVFAKHPGDYQLYEIGNYDDCSGLLTALIPMKLLGCAADFVVAEKSVLPGDVDFTKMNDMLRESIKEKELANGS